MILSQTWPTFLLFAMKVSVNLRVLQTKKWHNRITLSGKRGDIVILHDLAASEDTNHCIDSLWYKSCTGNKI